MRLLSSITAFIALAASPALATPSEVDVEFLKAMASGGEMEDLLSGLLSTGDGRYLSEETALDPEDRWECIMAFMDPTSELNPYNEGGPLEKHEPFKLLNETTDDSWEEICENYGIYTVCDTSLLFRNYRIKQICEADPVNGYFETATVIRLCEEGITVLENIPMCVFAPCSRTEYVLVHNVYKPMDDDCFSMFQFTGTGGLECIMENDQLYGNVTDPTPLTQYHPLRFITEEYLFDESICTPEFDSENMIISFDCDANNFLEGVVEPVCNDLNGTYMEVDIAFEIEEYEFNGMIVTLEISVENLPVCSGQSCIEAEALDYWDYIMEMGSGFDIISDVSKIDYCREKPKTKVYVTTSKKSEQPIRRSCFGLRKIEKAKEFACGQIIAPSGELLATEGCPATCGRCLESPKNEFVWSKVKTDGEVIVTPRTCGWLEKQKMSKQKKFCKSSIMSRKYSTASGACPDTCGLND